MSDHSVLRHRRAAELFLEATALDAEGRRAFLERLDREDPEMLREVESFLDHHTVRTILDESASSGKRRPAVGPGRRTSSSGSIRTGRILARLLGQPIRRAAAIGAAGAVLVAVGLWTHSRVEGSLLELRADELQGVIEADVTALEIWIESQKTLIEQWARDPRVVAMTEELLASESRVGLVETLKRPVYGRATALFTEQLARPAGVVIGLMTLRGMGLFSTSTALRHEIWLNAKGLGLAADALVGETIFVRPIRFGDIVREQSSSGTAYSYMLAAVRDTADQILAVMAVENKAVGPFSRIIGAAHVGETGETYAFDEDGVMLSKSRFDDELRARGLVHEAVDTLEVPDWDRSSMLNLHVRDPGGNVLTGYRARGRVEARPLTSLAAVAVGSRNATGSLAHRGLLLEPYRNHLGVDVIGAWCWIPEYGFGVATEIEVAEAFSPLRYLEISFGVLFALLVAAVAAALLSSFGLVRLRRRLGRLRHLGQYTLLEEIGSGGMGTVFLAQHDMLKRPTAVKMLSGDYVTDESAIRFEREVQMAGRLTHPNTIRIFDYGRTSDGVFYYAMEYIPGLSLAELVSDEGPLSDGRAIHVLKQVCESLEEAHELGMIHRDVKPQNIMLCQRGGKADVVKVLDFGLVKKIIDPDSLELTAPARIGGTPLYMAPERVTTPQDIDARVDVYSVGAVAYYLLTGKPVFCYEDELDLLYKIVNVDPTLPSEISNSAFTGEFESLIMSCLAKDPNDRPATVAELYAELEATQVIDLWTPEMANRWWARQQTATASVPVNAK